MRGSISRPKHDSEEMLLHIPTRISMRYALVKKRRCFYNNIVMLTGSSSLKELNRAGTHATKNVPPLAVG